jgi:hypothetical protein
MVYSHMHSLPSFWLLLLLVTAACMLLDLAGKRAWQAMGHPSHRYSLQQWEARWQRERKQEQEQK